jgi:hypothetical protein
MLALGAVAAGCAKNMPSQPATDEQAIPMALRGTWDYQATDTTDLSGYGITYAFNGSQWTYTLGDAGAKQFDFATNGDAFTATLAQDQTHSGEAIGSTMSGTYRISGDTLTMSIGGHNAILTRE